MTWWLIILFLFAGAQTNFTITVEENGIAEIHQELRAVPQEGRILTIIPFRIEEGALSAWVQGFPVSVDMTNASEATIVVIEWIGQEEVLVELDYYVYDITGKEKDSWNVNVPALGSTLTLLMPDNASIQYVLYDGDFPSITQEEGRLVLKWDNLEHPLTVYYNLDSSRESGSYYFLLPLPLLLLLIILFYYFSPRFARRREVNPSILSVLDERERSIVLFLAGKGKAKQAKISRQTGIPKTSLSKIMARLAERNIVAMEKDGNTTLCWLRHEIMK